MSHRPYPRRDRAEHQVERGRVAPSTPVPAQVVFGNTVEYLRSEEFRAKVRRLGVTTEEFLRAFRVSA